MAVRKTFILISCSSKKGVKKCKAEDMYISQLFKGSMSYAKRLKNDHIFILSAKYGLLDLDEIIDPYNVTLANIPVLKRDGQVKVLDKPEKQEWGVDVLQQLERKVNLKEYKFIFLAGKEYLNPLQKSLGIIVEPLKGLRQGKRLSFLKSKLS